MKKTILILSIALFTYSAQAGDGWVQPKNKGYFKLNQWWLLADQHFTNTGELDPNQTRGTFITSFYGEYGVSNKFTAMVYFPFFTRSLSYDVQSGTTGEIIQEGEAINSMGDTELTIKYGLLQKGPVFLTASYTAGLPLGIAQGGSDGSLQTGIGEFYQMFRFDASTSFQLGGKYPFVSVYAGFNQRFKNYSNEYRYGFKTGVELNKWIVIVQMNGVGSFQNVPNDFGSTGTTIFGNNTEYLSIAPEAGFKLTEKFGISASVAGAFWGKLILAAPSYSAGIFWTP